MKINNKINLGTEKAIKINSVLVSHTSTLRFITMFNLSVLYSQEGIHVFGNVYILLIIRSPILCVKDDLDRHHSGAVTDNICEATTIMAGMAHGALPSPMNTEQN